MSTAREVALDVARALRDVLRTEEAFGSADVVLPARTRVRPALAPERSEEPMADDRDEIATALAEMAAQVAECTKCGLCESRNLTVFGSGSPTADLMIVGEAPGADEDRTGLPFVGRAGQLLTKMLEAIDLNRDTDVYICNILKCRPPGNRNPEAPEIASCLPWLKRQIDLVAPRIIMTLGAPATHTLLDTREGITQIRGRVVERFGTKVLPSFHPAYLLRNPKAKRESWMDLQTVRRLLDA